MPDAEEDFAGALANSVIFMWVLVRRAVSVMGINNGRFCDATSADPARSSCGWLPRAVSQFEEGRFSPVAEPSGWAERGRFDLQEHPSASKKV